MLKFLLWSTVAAIAISFVLFTFGVMSFVLKVHYVCNLSSTQHLDMESRVELGKVICHRYLEEATKEFREHKSVIKWLMKLLGFLEFADFVHRKGF